MTNEEKYKMIEERRDAFNAFCDQYCTCKDCPISARGKIIAGRDGCVLYWLALEAEEEKPISCPFCGMYAVCDRIPGISPKVRCTGCGASIYRDTLVDAIAAWNRRAK